MSNMLSPTGARRTLVLVVCAITILMPFIVWLDATGDPFAYFTRSVPPGQTLYVMSKLLGLLAIVMFWFQCMAALAKDTPVLRGFFRLTAPWHALLGMATFAMAGLHLALFVAASSRRTGHLAFGLLMPQFDQGFYRAHVSLGAIAFGILLVVVCAGWRRLHGAAHWHWAHKLGFAVFALAFIHGINVGSETRFGLMRYVYAFVGLSLGTAVVSRLWVAARRYRRQPRFAEGRLHAHTQHEPIAPTD